MIDIRDHIRALETRSVMEQQLHHRPDIYRYAQAIIDAQVAISHGQTPIIPAELATDLPLPTALADVLVAGVEYDPAAGDIGLSIPGGTRFATLQFSPIMQFARLRSSDGRVGGKAIPALPECRGDLESWLWASMGLSVVPKLATETVPACTASAPISGATEDAKRARELERRDATKAVDDAFGKRFRFRVAELAAWLSELRTLDPVTYLLLISREFRLALKHMPTLNQTERDLYGTRRAFRKFAFRQILPVLTVAELQRTFAMTRELHRHGGATGTVAVRAVVHAKAPPAKRMEVRGAAISAAIARTAGPGHKIDQAPLHTNAIRRVLNLRGRRAAQLDVDAVYRAWEEGRDDWSNEKSSRTIVGAHELIASVIAPEIMKRDQLGKGHRLVDRPLDLFCGIEAAVVPYMAILELGLPLCGSKGRGHCAVLASAMLHSVTGFRSLSNASQEARHRRAVERLAHYLPLYPRLGSTGRFVATGWLERHRDRRLFTWLTTDRQLDRTKAQLDDDGWLIGLAVHLVKQEFPGVFANRRPTLHHLGLFCDLASAATTLTSDPILLSMLLRTISQAGSAIPANAGQHSNLQNANIGTALGGEALMMKIIEKRLDIAAR